MAATSHHDHDVTIIFGIACSLVFLSWVLYSSDSWQRNISPNYIIPSLNLSQTWSWEVVCREPEHFGHDRKDFRWD